MSNFNELINNIKNDFEANLMPINEVHCSINLENKIGAFAIGEALSGISVYLGYSLVQSQGLFFTYQVALYPWLVPLGVAAAITIAGVSLFEYVKDFKNNKRKLEDEFKNKSNEMLDNAVNAIIENFDKNTNQLHKFIKKAINIDIDNIINSIDKIKSIESEKDLSTLISKTNLNINEIDELLLEIKRT